MRRAGAAASVTSVTRIRATADVVDALIAGALVVAAEAHVWSGAAAGPKAITAPAGLVIAGSVAFRRRAPLAAVCAAMTAVAIQSALASSPQALWVIASWVILFYSAGRELDRDRAVVALGVGIAGAGVDEAFAADRSVSGFVFGVGALVVVPWLAGRTLRVHERRASLLERESAETTRRALEAERVRIARDLHDVVAHAVSLIVLKAEAAEAILDQDPARTRTQLASIQETGRQALVEMTRLLGVLRAGERDNATAQPRIAELPTLVERVRRAGLDVVLETDGKARPLDPGVDLTVYRVVQEALTNALKHGRPGGRAAVKLQYEDDMITIDVSNDVAAPQRSAGAGQGLIGMRERLSLYGGRVDAGPGADGRFAVKAVIPA
jgi:signal transduction histidine kinase